MTHFVGLVLGEEVDGQLERYYEHLEVGLHKVHEPVDAGFVEWVMSQDMVDKNGVDPSNLEAVVAYLNSCGGRYGVDEDGLFCWTDSNPDAKWDWWRIGGRWAGFLQLINGFGVNMAKAKFVDWDDTFEEYVPSVLVGEGVWQQRGEHGWWGSFEEEMGLEEWEQFVRGIVEKAGDVPVSVVDFHI